MPQALQDADWGRVQTPELYTWSCEEESWWVEKEEARLLSLNIIVRVSDTKGAKVVSPAFCVPKKKGFRMVVDLREVNKVADAPKFSMDTVEHLLPRLMGCQVGCVLDVADAFYHVQIHPDHQCYFTFGVVVRGEVRYYTLTCLPMGWCWSPFLLTTQFRVLGKEISRLSNNRSLLYLDDMFLGAATIAEGQVLKEKVQRLMDTLGLTEKAESSEAEVSHQPKFLGVILDLKEQQVVLPPCKVKQIRGQAGELLTKLHQNRCLIDVRMLRSFVGRASAACLAIPVGRAYLRRLYLNQGSVVRGSVRVDREGQRELKWWRNLTTKDEGWRRDFVQKQRTVETWFYDASLHGYGGTRGSGEHAEVVAGVWNRTREGRHITALEADAALRVARAFLPLLPPARGEVRHVELVGDSMAIVQANSLMRSKSWAVHTLIRELIELGWQYKVRFKHSWIPTDFNPADDPSRLEHSESYKFRWAAKLSADWNVPLKVDRFASYYNRQTEAYNSLLASPGSRGDAFMETWSDVPDGNWFNPPFSCLEKVIKKILREGCGGILIMPVWKTKPFWKLQKHLPVSARRLYTDLPLYCSEGGELLPAPKWATIAVRVLYSPR